MLTVNKIQREKSYLCKYCSNGFTTPQGLSRHINHNPKCIRNRKPNMLTDENLALKIENKALKKEIQKYKVLLLKYQQVKKE